MFVRRGTARLTQTQRLDLDQVSQQVLEPIPKLARVVQRPRRSASLDETSHACLRQVEYVA